MNLIAGIFIGIVIAVLMGITTNKPSTDGKTEHCATHGLVGKKWDCTPQEKAALKEKTK